MAEPAVGTPVETQPGAAPPETARVPLSASLIKRALVGRPLPSAAEQHQRLGKPTGLAVFASDAISSTAYATEEILLVLVPVAGMAALDDLIPIAIIVSILLVLVCSSYIQTIHAYPNGGGSYVVSRENLGVTPSLVAAASLLVDYVLTAAVSVSAGVAAITSAFPELFDYRVEICLGFIVLMTVANLRGLKESGRLFAGPTYIYILSLTALIGIGLFRTMTGSLEPMPVNEASLEELTNNGSLLGPVTVLLLLRAFSSGAVALTGVEAISNGVPAFRKPESRNASQTLVAMGAILGTAFLGISVLAHKLQPTVSEDETLLSIMGAAVFGEGSVPYYVLQFSTFAILILAANTAFADFPRVASVVSADGFLPRQLSNRGDRLVFSNGILALGAVSAVLVVAFKGDTSALIPLYAVGVFTGFTLSQAGMVRHHLRLREPRYRLRITINVLGAIATFIVLLVVVVSKFTIGAWIPAALIPIIAVIFLRIRKHYRRVASSLRMPEDYRPVATRHTVVVLVGSVHKGTIDALTYARSLRPDQLIAVSVAMDDAAYDRIVSDWERNEIDVELRVVHSPYRDLTNPLLHLLDEIDKGEPGHLVTVVVPEFVVNHWWETALHNQSAMVLRARLRRRPNTIITSVPLQIAPA
ncbi:MAG: APC family permease [Acidimicrobiales bacterium]|nr:APC family permease [Acidimicrobiales bacterium]